MAQQRSKVCPQCKHKNLPSDHYCGKCGTPFSSAKHRRDTKPAQADTVVRKRAPISSPAPTPPPQRPFLRRTIFFSILVVLFVGAFTLGIHLGKSGAPHAKTSIIHTYHISVNAQQDLPGMNTKIALTAGDQLIIKAAGEAKYGPLGPSTTPDGVSMANGAPSRAYYALCLNPSAPNGTLLGSLFPPGTSPSVGASAPTGWFVVGSNYSVMVWANAELYLIFNDIPNEYHDNSGHYQVTITVEHG